VNYQNGQLTIQAPNSTLSDILHAVRLKTGAMIDVPPGANERVVGQIGPGPAREVLASLLNGSHFNYVMVGNPTNPSAVAEVILSAKTGGAMAGSPSVYQPPQPVGTPYPNGLQPGMPQPVVQPTDPAGQAQQDAATDNSVETSEDQDTSQDNAPSTAVEETPAEPAEGAGQGQPAVKTPEQLLQELQRQQQLMQQQQQQQQQPGQPPQVVIPSKPPDQRQEPPQ